MPRADAAEIARTLAARIDRLAPELLPNGGREGAEFRAGNLAGHPGRSLAVHLTGERAGVWADFASGEAGDALDLVAAVRFRGEKQAALDWARAWLGREPPPPRAAPAPRHRPAGDKEAEDRRRAAVALFMAARPKLAGTPVAAYLQARGIDLAELGRQPRSLRFHPDLPNRESGRRWPAIVAAITGADGCHIGTHRTWLVRDAGGIWRKAPLRDPKMTLGSYAGGAVRLWRGASGVPLSAALSGETVALAEGIETALSVVIACPELRVLAGVSLANLARVVLPASVATVIIVADNDPPENEAAAGLARAIAVYMDAGRTVRVARSPIGKDMNDALVSGMDDAGEGEA